MLKEITGQEKRKQLMDLLGELPDRQEGRVKARLVDVEDHGLFTLEKLTLELNGIEPVPAYFVKPKPAEGEAEGGKSGEAGALESALSGTTASQNGASGTGTASGKLPVVLFNHSHGGNYHVGKDELLAGASYLKKPSYAEVFAKEGYAVLCIDAWCFGERRGRTETQIFKDMLWNGRVLFGMMAFDGIRAVDYLYTRDDVDCSRIATVGLSMGGTMAWWLSALDPRIKVCVDLCSLTDFHTLAEVNGFDGHGIYYYIPSLLKHFSTADINKLIAPRPHLSQSGKYDHLVPYAGVLKIDKELQEAYSNAGVGDAWQLRTYPCGHMETTEMRQETLDFLRKWL